MKSVVVVGSGASGVHFALSVLKKGYDVTLLDVGRPPERAVDPSNNLNALKENLDDPAEYFLGKNLEAAILPGHEEEYYGFPPNKQHIFEAPAQFRAQSHGFTPLVSFGRGGLGEAWTGGVYAFHDSELADFPITYADLAPHYAEVSRRIGINGAVDDLARFFPIPAPLQEPLRLDEHSAALLARYPSQREWLNEKLGCFLGRSRVATLSQPLNDRKACGSLGRCLWGCPTESLYTPSLTLRECQSFSNFHYIPNTYVSHFELDVGQRVAGVVAEALDSGESFRLPTERLVLAAGTLMSSRIFLESIFRATGETVALTGLMDNRQLMVPFLNLAMVGRAFNPESYQYHQLALGLLDNDPRAYIHCQITTLKTALIHPIVQAIPLDLRTSLFLFRHLHAALGLVNVNFADTRRISNEVSLAPDPDWRSALAIRYAPARDERRCITRTLRRIRRALWALGCVVPPGTTRVRPPGASVHYAGTIPMTNRSGVSLTTTPDCQSRDFPNLFFVDGATFPFLPAKNITYTLMANAVRVAERAF